MKPHPILAGALLAALSFATLEAGATAGGTVTLGQFGYTLTDLDPNDGITPSIAFLPLSGSPDDAAMIRLEYEEGAQAPILVQQSVNGAPVSLDASTPPSLTLSGSATGLGSLASTSVTATAVENDRFGSVFSSAWGGAQRFVLSPHTELSVIATAHYSGLLVPTSDDYFGMSAEIRLDGTGPNGYFLDDFSADGYSTGYNAPSTSIDRILHVVGAYANDSDSSLSGSLQLVAGVDATALDFAPHPVPAPVPEPAGVALYAAGLPLLLALRRRAGRPRRPHRPGAQS